MERTGGEPDVMVPFVIGNDKKSNEFVFVEQEVAHRVSESLFSLDRFSS